MFVRNCLLCPSRPSNFNLFLSGVFPNDAGNSCYYSVQTLLSSRLLPMNLNIKIYKTIILSIVLYGCEAWSLTLREEFRLRIFENRILRRIFGPKRDKNGEWTRLHNVELHSLYRSPNIVRLIKSRRLRWSGHVARMDFLPASS